MRIKIAEIVCEFNIRDVGLKQNLEARYDAFIVSDEPLFQLSVEVEQEKGLLKRSMSNNTREDQSPIVVIDMSDQILKIKRLDNPFIATVDTNRGHGEVILSDNQYCFDSFLRIIYSILLARTHGVLLHSVGIKLGGDGCVFMGASESGKTTLASLTDDLVFSDEFVAIRKIDGRYHVFSTPFWGEFVAGKVNATARLSKIYLLRKGPDNFTKPLAKAKALRELLSCTLFFGPQCLTGEVLAICADLVEKTTVEELYFLPTQVVFEFLKVGEVQNV